MIRTTSPSAPAALLLGAALLAGCSSSDDDGGGLAGPGTSSGGDSAGPPPPTEAPATLLEGAWESGCLAPRGMVGESSRRLVISIIDRVFTFNEELFGDSLCTEPQQTFATRGTFTEGLPEDGRDVTDGIPVDLMVNDVVLTPAISRIADDYNRQAFCMRTDWAAGREQIVSGCDDLAGIIDVMAPRTDYNRFFVDNNMSIDDRSDDRLLLGTLSAQPDESMRPDQVSEEVPFTRRPNKE